jgi:hypothetical protein
MINISIKRVIQMVVGSALSLKEREEKRSAVVVPFVNNGHVIHACSTKIVIFADLTTQMQLLS